MSKQNGNEYIKKQLIDFYNKRRDTRVKKELEYIVMDTKKER